MLQIQKCSTSSKPSALSPLLAYSRDSAHHHDNLQNNTVVFSTCSDAARCARKCTRALSQDTTPSPSTKQTHNSDRLCSNTHCGAPQGHVFEDCIAYGRGSQGKYTGWWKGPWNIHLPPGQCNRSNNVPPPGHLANTNPLPTSTKPAVFYMHNNTNMHSHYPSKSSMTDNAPHVCTVTITETPHNLWDTLFNDKCIVASLPVLERSRV